MEDKVVAIYPSFYYTSEDYDNYISSNKYNYIFEKVYNITWSELKDNESLTAVLLDEDTGVWEAELFNSKTDEYRYIGINQGIFE